MAVTLPVATVQGLAWQNYTSQPNDLIAPYDLDFTTYSEYDIHPAGIFGPQGNRPAEGLVVDNILGKDVVRVIIGPLVENVPPYTKVMIQLGSASPLIKIFGTSYLFRVSFFTGTFAGSLAATNFYQAQLQAGLAVATGIMYPFAGASASVPTGYLLCDGLAVSRSTYAGLFSIIGTAFGVGDGSTTFNVPNMSDQPRTLVGSTPALVVGAKGGAQSVVLSKSNMPAYSLDVTDPGHNHVISDPGHNHALNTPTHNHVMYDAGHSHPANQAAHNHGLTDPGHNHGVVDPTHTHGQYDAGHVHPMSNPVHTHPFRTYDASRQNALYDQPFVEVDTTQYVSSVWAVNLGYNSIVVDGKDGVRAQDTNSGSQRYLQITPAATNVSTQAIGTGAYNYNVATGNTNGLGGTAITLGAAQPAVATGVVSPGVYTQPVVSGDTMNAATTGISVNARVTGITVATGGGAAPVSIVPPYLAVNWIIKT